MANRRMIYQDFFEDDYFGTVEIGLRLLWIGLIAAAADDQGRILDNSALIRAKVFMYDSDITDKQIDSWLDKLNADGKIIRYVADGKNLIQIAKWWDYQTPSWASESKYPALPRWTDRIKCHVAGGTIKNVNWDKDGGIHNGIGSTLPKPKGRPINDINDDINDDYDDDYDGESTKITSNLFEQCQVIYETKKGYPITDGASFALMIKNFEANGVMAEDYAAAIDAMSANPKYARANKPTSYEAWAIGIADKRRNPVKISKRESVEVDNQALIMDMIQKGEI